MKQQQFEDHHQQQWQIFADDLQALEQGRPDEARIMAFPAAYRRICQHLALARTRGYSRALIEQLQYLAMNGHRQLYRQRSPLPVKILLFLSVGLPQLIRAEYRVVLTAGLLFYGSLLGMLLLVQVQPDLVYSMLSPTQVAQLETMYDPDSSRLGRFGERTAVTDWMMFGYYIMNNISIAFQTFAAGLLFGLGSLFFLIYNGLTIGSMAGHLGNIGYQQPFWSFVIGHSAFELTAIVLSGAAGLKLGWALIAPGRRRRSAALRLAASQGVRLVTGALLLLLIAAFIEAYWSSMTFTAPIIKYLVGCLLWLLVGIYLLRAGKDVHAAA
ncbi:stage II sporulation protein M [Azomonas macrocytogenes]|uniref:Putative membrane protein SpoIIM required for sporulation n=1 Tax=Azomonas macrocytogenes TaxID=69962 RepID=A0A839T3G1_AZOMA|nr:stage II sporulation protein M [Azomonas macrocytogenes]MBB3104071.1 putative membrane protein SpoIIM required for sporulation [Azomonas macrocytogenes]